VVVRHESIHAIAGVGMVLILIGAWVTSRREH
jgi:drug/metabolite transporter (DMT)-like permease